MKSSIIESSSNNILTLAAVAGAIVITALGIELLYQLFQFIETNLAASVRQVTQLISYYR